MLVQNGPLLFHLITSERTSDEHTLSLYAFKSRALELTSRRRTHYLELCSFN